MTRQRTDEPADLFGFTTEELMLYKLRALEAQLPVDYSTEECEHGFTGYCFDCDDEANHITDDMEEDPNDPRQWDDEEDDDEQTL